MHELEGYRKIRATDLPLETQTRLRNLLRHELTVAMMRSVMDRPPELDLAEIEMVLRPGQLLRDFDVAAECSTCGTCGTCVTCVTCVTS
jgi:hypothetical protein